MSSTTKCAAIGEGNLLLCSLEDINSYGLSVSVVFTNTESVQQFCENSNIPCYPRNADLVEILQQSDTDYLFSISNPRILKEDVLRIPKFLTINYHDSPLPTYAGVHATSWAIINGEKQHGISWHVVEIGIDTGDILQSERVDIVDNDSAFTLNLKCVEAAKTAFKRLLIEIKNKALKRKEQQKTKRTYYGLHAIPPNVGVLNFSKNAEDLYNLCRGLEFGNHENALGSAKIMTNNDEFYLVTNVSKSVKVVGSFPGEIIDAVDDTLTVGTDDASIQVSIAKLDGSTLPSCIFREKGLTKGSIINANIKIDNTSAELVAVRKKESFWRREMLRYEPTMFYRQKMNVVAGIIEIASKASIVSEKLYIPHGQENQISVEYLQACFIAFLARINCTEYVHVGLVANKRGFPSKCENMYASVIPVSCKVDLTSNVYKVFENCLQLIQKRKCARTFLLDMFHRYPELRGHKRVPHHNIVLGSKCEDEKSLISDVLQDCNVLMLFDKNCQSIDVLYHDRPAQDYSHITDVLQHFSTFLNAIKHCNIKALRCISMVSESDLNRFYRPQIGTSNNCIKKEKLAPLIKRQCKLTPLSIAVKTTKSMMTYSRLSEEILTFTNILQGSFINCSNGKPLVALYLPNSVQYVVTLLTLAANDVAFLPLPVDSPADRLVFTLKDAGVNRMIAAKSSFDKCDLNGLTRNLKVIKTHKISGEILVLVEINEGGKHIDYNDNIFTIGNKVEKDNTFDEDFAYLMYTSGSTGRPKGVKVKETGVINLARAQITCWDIGPGDVIAQFASIGFDASISEIFTSLLSGASLAVLDSTERLGSDFESAMNKMKVSVITLPPSALNIYSPKEFPYLKKVVTAGEACTLNSAVKWTSANNVRFFNAYGPTETTVCATCYEYTSGTIYEDVNRDLPIGKAIDGMHVFLFDDFQNPVPPDVIGEIYIGGKGLSHGYIGHAVHFNQDKFVRNSLDNGRALLYKTGDHAFQDKDGNITFVGRTDDQIKLRGNRIDLSEIEQVLIQHSKVEIAVVVVHKCANNNETSLAAYIAPTFIYISELREYLSKVLPKYMIPTYIKKIKVSDLPKTLNGKINRKQLENDERIHEHKGADDHSHLNDTQLFIGKLWCDVFRLEESFIYSFHRQSSFSELGGNSLQLVLLLRLIENALDIEISFTDLGTADTIEEFAEVIRRRRDMSSKKKPNETQSNEELREMIIHDSELDMSFFPNHERKRSVQIHQDPIATQHSYKGLRRPQNVLISGVTGFLGAFLLSELLEQSNAHICCMVRESTEVRGMGRVIDNMRKYGLWKFEYSTRLAIVISDLSKKNMGIAPDIYKSLCNVIDVVFMNAAMMNFNTSYEDHRIANVHGTKEFIKFASTGNQKYIFSTSSLGVFLFPREPVLDDQERRFCKESEFFDDPLLIESGYGQSKWASERLIMQALDFLPGGAIFRPARVSGRSTDGMGPRNDLFASTMIGMKRLGAYPDMDYPFDLTPVDFCAKAMVEIAFKLYQSEHNTHDRVYHFFNNDTIPFKELFAGMHLQPLPLEEWRHLLKQSDDTQKELLPLMPFFMSQFWDLAPNWPVFSTQNTDREMSDSVKDLMKPTRELLQIYKTYFGV